MDVFKSSKIKKFAILLGSTLTFILGYYVSVYHTFYYQTYNDLFGLLLVSSSIMTMTFICLNLSLVNKKKNIIVSIIAVVLTLIATGFIFVKTISFNKNQLDLYGVVTKACVVGFESGYKSTKYATISYESNGNKILQRIMIVSKDHYEKGDSIQIRFSSEHPELFKEIK
jgi:hypothetical protein